MTINNTEINFSTDLFISTVKKLNCNFGVQKSNANAQKGNMESLHFKDSNNKNREGYHKNCSKGEDTAEGE
jgi:hypothetical protein